MMCSFFIDLPAFITTMMASMKVNPWIGLHKNWGEQMLWVNNDEITYTNWAYGEPNDRDLDSCVQVSLKF